MKTKRKYTTLCAFVLMLSLLISNVSAVSAIEPRLMRGYSNSQSFDVVIDGTNYGTLQLDTFFRVELETHKVYIEKVDLYKSRGANLTISNVYVSVSVGDGIWADREIEFFILFDCTANGKNVRGRISGLKFDCNGTYTGGRLGFFQEIAFC